MIRYWRTIAVTLAAALSVVGIVRAEPPDSPVKSDVASCTRPDFRVVLDVGHTAKSPGAKSARGADEFDFNLRLAKQIDQALLEAGFAKTVLMVTEGPGRRRALWGGGSVRCWTPMLASTATTRCSC
jgi:N-acetylmuramoyl-L-alanine amidase